MEIKGPPRPKIATARKSVKWVSAAPHNKPDRPIITAAINRPCRGPIRSIKKPQGRAARIYIKGQAPNTVPISPKVIFRSSVIGVTNGPRAATVRPKLK